MTSYKEYISRQNVLKTVRDTSTAKPKRLRFDPGPTLFKIYDFSKTRSFRFGLNEKHMNKADLDVLKFLYNNGFIFYKISHNNRYWLPTLKGRELVEKRS